MALIRRILGRVHNSLSQRWEGRSAGLKVHLAGYIGISDPDSSPTLSSVSRLHGSWTDVANLTVQTALAAEMPCTRASNEATARHGPVPASKCSVYPQPGKFSDLKLKLAHYDFSCPLTLSIVCRPRHMRGNGQGKQPPRWSLDDQGVVTPLDPRQPDGK